MLSYILVNYFLNYGHLSILTVIIFFNFHEQQFVLNTLYSIMNKNIQYSEI